jgi:hypothetical protein
VLSIAGCVNVRSKASANAALAQALQAMPHLVDLDVSDTALSGRVLMNTAPQMRLERLAAARTFFSVYALRLLAEKWAPSLRHLNLAGCAFVNAKGMQFVRRFSLLESLDLSRCLGLHAQDLLALRGLAPDTLRHLRRVDVSGVPGVDAAAAAALAQSLARHAGREVEVLYNSPPGGPRARRRAPAAQAAAAAAAIVAATAAAPSAGNGGAPSLQHPTPEHARVHAHRWSSEGVAATRDPRIAAYLPDPQADATAPASPAAAPLRQTPPGSQHGASTGARPPPSPYESTAPTDWAPTIAQLPPPAAGADRWAASEPRKAPKTSAPTPLPKQAAPAPSPSPPASAAADVEVYTRPGADNFEAELGAALEATRLYELGDAGDFEAKDSSPLPPTPGRTPPTASPPLQPQRRTPSPPARPVASPPAPAPAPPQPKQQPQQQPQPPPQQQQLQQQQRPPSAASAAAGAELYQTVDDADLDALLSRASRDYPA